MLKYNEKSIGNINLISTFLILMFVAFAVIMLSVNSKLEDFENLEREIKTKFLNDKKSDIKYKIHNINVLIDSQNFKDTSKNQKFIKEFISEINKSNYHTISIKTLTKNMPYFNILQEKGEYFKYDKYYDENTQKDISTIEYMVLNKKWNWVISTKFNDDIINDELQTWEAHLLDLIKDNIYVHIALLFLFSIALLLVMYVINKFSNKTISKCRDSIKEREKDLKQEIHKLQQKVDEEIEKYNNQSRLLQKQSKILALGETIGNLSHQWRQPLSAIGGAIQDIKDSNSDEVLNSVEGISNLDTIGVSVMYMSRTIDDFRDFLKADSLRIDFVANDIVDKALDLNHGIIEKNHIKIVKNFDKDLSIYNLSHGLLQVVVNIMSNSKDALKMLTENDRMIFLTTENKKETIEITITDTAGGIPEDIVTKIFDPYFTTKKKTNGTGLGLHMAYNIIKQNMGGEISVSTKQFEFNGEKYCGASFKITLPVNEK